MSESFRKHIKKQHFPVHPSNIKFWTQFRNCIHESLKKRDWKEIDSDGDWDLCWVEKETVQDLFGHLLAHQRINHFRNHYEITRKDLLIKNLKRHRKALEKEGKLDEAASYNFFPVTYNLPNEYTIFCDEFKKASHNIWIMKPIGKSQGKGIFLFKKLSQISDWKLKEDNNSQVENYIVQRYIHNPLLIGGKKFDLRIYCLVTSYSPLTAYLYRDGFARFTHHRYDNTDISNSYVHLTNVAIQKHSENYDKKLGGKWDLRTLKLYMTSKYGHEAVSLCFANIQQVILKTLYSVQKMIIQDKHCFELYGFDILIDSHLKPWVLEVNGSPSMTANTTQDNELKCGLLDDVFTVIDLEKILTGQEEQIGGFDLICKGEPVTNNGTDMNPSMLGCHNNRTQQLRSLAKVISMRLAQIHQRKKELNAETKKLKEKDKEKDIQPLPIALSTDSLANARKNRSKSTMKGSIASQTVMPAAKMPAVRNVFNPKAVLAPLSHEGRENREVREMNDIKDIKEVREGRALVQKQQPVRLYKGKTVDLPPVSNPNNNPNNVSVQNLVFKSSQAPGAVSSSQPHLTQNILNSGISGILMKNNGMMANPGISRSYSNLNVSEIIPKQQSQSKIATHANIPNLNNSSANSMIMNSFSPDKGQKSDRDFSPLQVTRILKPKMPSDKNLLSAQWHPTEAYNYSIEGSSLVGKGNRRDSKQQLKEIYTPEGSTKSFTARQSSKHDYPSHTNLNLYLSNNEPSASKNGGGTSRRDSGLNSDE